LIKLPTQIAEQFDILQDEIIPVEPGEVNNLLLELKESIAKGTCVFQPREKNNELEIKYAINEEKKLEILKNLTGYDFKVKKKDTSNGARDRKKKGFPDEQVYIFILKQILLVRNPLPCEMDEKEVKLYIKINNRTIPRKIIIIISFHEALK